MTIPIDRYDPNQRIDLKPVWNGHHQVAGSFALFKHLRRKKIKIDKTTWSLEQQYEYAHYEIEIGLSDQTVAALPTSEDLSVDEARRLVQEKLYAQLAAEEDASSIDLGNYHESVHFWRYPDYGGAWVFEYYGEDRKAPEFTGTLYQDTDIISIDIHDKNDLQALYQYHCALHNFKTFRWWGLDEQYEFYTLVVSLQQRQIEKYG